MFKGIFKKISNTIFGIRFYSTIPTCQRYPHIKKYDFNVVGPKDIEYFDKILSNEQILIDENLIEHYNTDWLKECKGASKLVLRPKTSEQISNILKYCNANKLPVVPQGGNTGLVHGSIPVFDEIILSLSLMNYIESIDTLSGILVCQSGCILKQINDHIGEKGFIVPLDLGSKGSCQIGGNLSTNAGGIRLIRYGPLRGSILGIEAVLADGSVLDCMNTMRKDNTGYDLKQLFIGSEGTLGVITKVAIQCQPKPSDMNVAFFGCDDFGSIIKAYSMARQTLGETLSAFEFMDKGCMDAVVRQLGYRNPIANHSFYFLVEVAGCEADHNADKMAALLTALLEGEVADGTISSSGREYNDIWKMREDIYTAVVPKCASTGTLLLSYDLSLPIRLWPDLVARCREIATPAGGSAIFLGHFGDQNVHINVMIPVDKLNGGNASNNKKLVDQLVYKIYPRGIKRGDYSISAEHGIGLSKMKAFTEMFAKTHDGTSTLPTTSRSDIMRSIKLLLDPNLILNPYKLFTF